MELFSILFGKKTLKHTLPPTSMASIFSWHFSTMVPTPSALGHQTPIHRLLKDLGLKLENKKNMNMLLKSCSSSKSVEHFTYKNLIILLSTASSFMIFCPPHMTLCTGVEGETSPARTQETRSGVRWPPSLCANFDYWGLANPDLGEFFCNRFCYATIGSRKILPNNWIFCHQEKWTRYYYRETDVWKTMKRWNVKGHFLFILRHIQMRRKYINPPTICPSGYRKHGVACYAKDG